MHFLPTSKTKKLLTAYFLLLTSIRCQTTPKTDSFQHAFEYYRDGLYREALDSFKENISKENYDPKNLKYLGISYVKVGNYKKASKTLKEASSHFSEDSDLYFYLGEADRGLNNLSEAIFWYQKSLQANDKNIETLNALSWTFYRIRYYKKALEVSQRAFNLKPFDSHSSLILTRILLKLRRIKEAKSMISSSFKYISEGEKPYFYSLLGDVYYQYRKLSQAKSAYEKALKADPLLSGALLGMGKIYLQRKQTKNAIKYLQRSARIKPTLVETLYLLAIAHEKQDPQKSIQFYKKFYAQVSQDPEYLALLGKIKKKISLLEKTFKN